FFFFQAEDGIRDRTVTGVQTCALPIFGMRSPSTNRLSAGAGSRRSTVEMRDRPQSGFAGRILPVFWRIAISIYFTIQPYHSSERSEERRVGKECRSRWWTYR